MDTMTLYFGVTFLLLAGTCAVGARETRLKLWRHQIEVGFQSLSLAEGSEFTVTCDGSRAPSGTDPHVRWYGADKYWIAHEGAHNRVYVEYSFTGRFLRLHFREVLPEDAGKYVCRGWMGTEWGWYIAAVTLTVEPRPTRRPPVTSTRDVTELLTHPTRRPPVTSTRDVTELRTRPTRRPQVTTTRDVTELRTETTTTLPPGGVTTEQSQPQPIVTSGRDECVAPRFRCGSGECFDENYKCDTYPDCEDESDEQNCASTTCNEGMTSCADGDGCVTSQQVCDGKPHCRDGSDESPVFCG